jgi:hypothetical protein
MTLELGFKGANNPLNQKIVRYEITKITDTQDINWPVADYVGTVMKVWMS